MASIEFSPISQYSDSITCSQFTGSTVLTTIFIICKTGINSVIRKNKFSSFESMLLVATNWMWSFEYILCRAPFQLASISAQYNKHGERSRLRLLLCSLCFDPSTLFSNNWFTEIRGQVLICYYMFLLQTLYFFI